MFSSGWMWLVTDRDAQLAIVPTFGAGTLLVQSSASSPALEEWVHAVGQPTLTLIEQGGQAPSFTTPSDPHVAPSSSSTPPLASSPLSGALLGGLPPIDPHTPARTMSTHYPTPRNTHATRADPSRLDPKKLGATLYPLLCVSVHVHAWVSAGYGVWGKEEYMKRFWTVVDWAKVDRIFNKVLRSAH